MDDTLLDSTLIEDVELDGEEVLIELALDVLELELLVDDWDDVLELGLDVEIELLELGLLVLIELLELGLLVLIELALLVDD